MEPLPYEQLSSRIHGRLNGQRIPALATIEVTRRCPLDCSHCYNNLPMGDAAARSEELTLAEHRRILDELADAGCLWMVFSGGEIFARRDFLDIYTYAKKKGFLITLFTNGTLITERIADYLVEWRPFSIEITLYGRTRETYEKLTQIPGSYDHCMNGIRVLMERKLPLKLKTVAVSVNKHEVWDMKKFAEEELGLEFQFDSIINPRIDCSSSPLAVRLSPGEVVQLDLTDPQRTLDWKKFAGDFAGPVHAAGQDDALYHCGGGINSLAIDPYGRMSICVLSHFDTYELRQGSILEGWDVFLGQVRSKRITRPTKCVRCTLKAICGMCPANGELENRDPEEPVDYLCNVGHLRAAVFDIPVPEHGDCEYCAMGANHGELMETASALREGYPLPTVLPERPKIVEQGCSGGCSSCSLRA